jgi:hypothetical protein
MCADGLPEEPCREVVCRRHGRPGIDACFLGRLHTILGQQLMFSLGMLCCPVLCCLQELSSDNERLRLSASAARETAARQADELSRLQRDHARLSAAAVRGQHTGMHAGHCHRA